MDHHIAAPGSVDGVKDPRIVEVEMDVLAMVGRYCGKPILRVDGDRHLTAVNQLLREGDRGVGQ